MAIQSSSLVTIDNNWTDDLQDGLNVEIATTTSLNIYVLNPAFNVAVRTGDFLVGIDLFATTFNIAEAWNRDYRTATGVRAILKDEDDTIEHFNQIRFEPIADDDYSTRISISHQSPPVLTIVNTVPIAPIVFQITGVTVQQADTEAACTHVRYNIAVSGGTAPYSITSPVNKAAPTEADLFIDFERLHNPQRNVVITDADGNSATLLMPRVDTWEIGDETIITTVNGSQITTVLNVSGTDGVINPVYEYSLGGAFQTSPVFSNVIGGTYTLTIRDNYGCTKTKQITVPDAITPEDVRPDPFFDISRILGIRHVDNALECNHNSLWEKQIFTNIQYKCYEHTYNKADVVPIQMRSSYRNIVAKLKDAETDEEVKTYTVSRTIQYTDLQYDRDETACVLTELPDGRTGLTFIESDRINGSLPETFLRVGVEVTISGGTFADNIYVIEETMFDPSTQRQALVIDTPYVSTAVSVPCAVNIEYDLNPWDAYRFDASFADLEEGFYYIDLQITDSLDTYPDLNWRSEIIDVQESHLDTVLITYRDNDGSVIDNVIPDDGIINVLRLPARFFNFQPDGSTEVFRNDRNNIRKQKQLYSRIIKLEIYAPYWIYDIIAGMTAHDTITINDISYTCEELPEIEQLDERDPFYIITANMQENKSIVKTDPVGQVPSNVTILGTSTVGQVIKIVQ